MTTAGRRLGYRRELDGLRAVAVLAVMLYHAGFAACAGGYLGVDVFFVISGYLIAAVVMADLERAAFSLAGFFERRARRLLPALFLVMLACLPPAWWWLRPPDMTAFAKSLVAVTLFAANVQFWRESGYFTTDAGAKPLLHTWSLGVEEQFYLLFPVAFAWAWRRGRRRAAALVTAVGLASLGLAQWQASAAPTAAFYLLPARAWELLLGVLAALQLHAPGAPARWTPGRGLAEIGGALGLAVVLVAMATFGETTPHPSLYTLLPTGGTVSIIVCASGRTAVGRLLGSRGLVGIGLISYSTYLWHQPLLAFARYRYEDTPGTLGALGLLLVALLLGALTWRFVERPIRQRRRLSTQAFWRGVGVAAAFFVTLGAAGYAFRGAYRQAWLDRQSALARATFLVIEATRAVPTAGAATNGDGRCRFSLRGLDDRAEARLLACRDRYGPGHLILGDSHATDLLAVALAGSREPFVVGLTQNGCRVHTPTVDCAYYRQLQALVARHPGLFRVVIYEQAGFYLLRTPTATGSRALFAAVPLDQPIQDLSVDRERVALVVAYLRALRPFVRVVWFGPRIEPHIGDQTLLRYGCAYRYRLRANQEQTFLALDGYIARAVAASPGLRFISQNKAYAFDFSRDLIDCRARYWRDGDHFSLAGAVRFGARADVLALADHAVDTGPR